MTDSRIETLDAWIRLDDEGILRVKKKPNVDITLEDVKEDLEVMRRLAEGERRLLVMDSTAVRSISVEARKFLGGEEVAAVVKAVGVIANSPVSRVAANFFLGLSKPIFPLKLFSTEHDALQWLRQQ